MGKLDFIDDSIKPLTCDFNKLILKNKQSIQAKKSAQGMLNSGAYFYEVKNMLFIQVQDLTEKILNLIKTTLKKQKIVHKIKPKIVHAKVELYLNGAIEQSREFLKREVAKNAYGEKILEQLLDDFNGECKNYSSKVHADINLSLKEIKIQVGESNWFVKAIKFIFSRTLAFLGGIITAMSIKIADAYTQEIITYLKKII